MSNRTNTVIAKRGGTEYEYSFNYEHEASDMFATIIHDSLRLEEQYDSVKQYIGSTVVRSFKKTILNKS